MESADFFDVAIVSCGTLSLEIKHLQKEGFLNAAHIAFTTPGLHEDVAELERQLTAEIGKSLERAAYVLVVYGGKFCYVNVDQPTRTMETIVREQGPRVGRVHATHCMDMLADAAERDRIAREVAGGAMVWWMTPGWIRFRSKVFKDWDKAQANENFPRHDGGAVVLDGVGFMDKYMAEKPEEFLEYSDWMGIPIQPYPVSLDRFKGLLTDALGRIRRENSET
ncbi:MAG: DUF1638 domain-containing protein [Desulfococcaceae bacterium]